MMIDLSGKTALVTGGGQGLGRAIALVLARQGADVAIGDIDLGNAEESAALIRDSGRRAMALKLDVSSRSGAKQAVDQIVDEWGAIDILVNNAGVVSARARDGESVPTEEEWEFVLGVNLNGVVNCTDAVLPHMSSARYGKIINIASTAGKSGDPPPVKPITVQPGDQVRLGGSAYAASKAAVIRHTQIVASSAAPFNINANTVCPSRLITPMGIQIAKAQISQQSDIDDAELVELRRDAVLQNNRFNRELEPVDIGNTVAFLASDDARNITGQSINVDGGYKMT
jgi:NAD(P)-dependent dehydrogenase (short-subunit alcohol dehydrogenase family)